MRVFSAVIGVVLSYSAASHASQTDMERVIQDAMDHGAQLVDCQQGRCVNRTTQETWKDPETPDGIILVYPNTAAGLIQQRATQSQLRPSL